MQVVFAAITAMIGVVMINICTVGYLRSKVTVITRALCLIGGVLMLMPQFLPSLIGFVIGGAAIMVAWRKPSTVQAQ